MALITDEVRKAVQSSVLCWLATVDANGHPNVSPKELFCVHDASHLVIANIASPGSAKNINDNAAVCVSFVDVLVQKGFKVHGLARNILASDSDFEQWATQLKILTGTRFRIHSIFVIHAEKIEPIMAPSYHFFPDEVDEESQIESALKRYGVTKRT